VSYIDWMIVGGAILLALLLPLSFLPRFARYSLAQLPGAGGELPPASLLPSITRRLAVQTRVTATAGIVALVGAYAVLRVGSPATNADLYVALATAGVTVGLAEAIFSTRQQLRRPDTSVRLARLRVVTINDYVSSWSRILAWVTVAIGVTIVLIRDSQALGGANGTTAGTLRALVPTSVVALFALVGLAMFELVGRAIVARSQPAGSPEELVWDDAQRASSLLNLLQVPVQFGAYGLLWLVITSQPRSDSPYSVILGSLSAGLFVGVIGCLIALLDSRSRYRRRLWPNWPSANPADAAEVVGIGKDTE
jgi:hypothetical protein